MAEKKEKKYVSDNAQLMAEWNWEKNNELGFDPHKLTSGSNKKVWWTGKCGHSWETQIKTRSIGRGCPICAGKTVVSGFNDLQTLHPDILSEWDYQKNEDIQPYNISSNSHVKVWWKCHNGHSWQASPNHRISKDRNCPYCAHNPRVLPGITDLETIHPEIAAEWHPIKNGTLLPSQVTANSSKRVWWKCNRGHEWKTAINHRANGSNCPRCAKALQTSFPEQAIYYYVRKAYPDAINSYKELFNNHGMELDIYIPSVSIGIEYDGIIFHKLLKNQHRDMKKYKICKENNIMLIRVREDLNEIVDDICDYVVYNKENLNAAIIELSKYLPQITDINVERDDAIIRAEFYSDLEKYSLAYLYPNLAKEWNYVKNGELQPNMLRAHSNIKVWWKCDKGHEWKASIDDRSRGNGCPYCSNNIVLKGYNDLASKRPDLIKEWDYEKNIFQPDSITSGSGKKAWWVCSVCGNNWLAEISSRNKGTGCPICAKEKRKANKKNTD